MKTAAKISPVNIKARQELDIRAGDTVKVHQKIKEGDKSRIQIFEGLVLARKHGAEAGGTFTVRKVASGVGVERIFPLFAPSIEKVEVTKRSKVRRAKLYHIREKATKEVSRQLRREVTAPETKSLAHEGVPAEEKSAE
ncbi:MAG TPA: 50S ribosomal protein L19 [Candidatus Paceibacterota bacterium]|nr:50S ribosomal protein L19 [Candidatus Paceibacterota bacterium]